MMLITAYKDRVSIGISFDFVLTPIVGEDVEPHEPIAISSRLILITGRPAAHE